MHYLGVPTTRAGTIVTSDSRVVRDIFYTGNIVRERCSVVLRIAPSFIRFGSFEIFKAVDGETGREGPSVGNVALLEQLTNYCIDTLYPAIASAHPVQEGDGQNVPRYKAFFEEVVDRTINMVVQWQRTGFCHGVLNTDNMSILGLTIDYGPFGFLESYDPNYVCNGSDKDGRYSFQEQPRMCKWNCGKLAEALLPILPKEESAEVLGRYDSTFNERFNAMMLTKVGLHETREPEDGALVSSLLTVMEQTGADWTSTFSMLTEESSLGDVAPLAERLASVSAGLDQLANRCMPRYPPEHLAKLVGLAQSNPSYLQMMGVDPAAVYKDVEKLKVLRKLEKTTKAELRAQNTAAWSDWLGRYAERISREFAAPDASCDKRRALMRAANPAFVMRNSVVQQAIDAAEELDFTTTAELLELLKHPYDPQLAAGSSFQWRGVKEWKEELVVT